MAHSKRKREFMETMAKKMASGFYTRPEDALGDLMILEEELAPEFESTSPQSSGFWMFKDAPKSEPIPVKLSYDVRRSTWVAIPFGGSEIDASSLRGLWMPIPRS